MTDFTGLTPTQIRMLEALADGLDHPRKDLEACLPDSLGTRIDNHLVQIRKLLRPQGQDIACVVNCRRAFYRWVSLCPPAMEALRRRQQILATPSTLAPRAQAP